MSLTNGACLRRILRIHYSQHVSNAEVRRCTDFPPLSDTIRSKRLRLFGHIVLAGPEMEHCRALHSVINTGLEKRRGHPSNTWTRTIEADLKLCNIGLHSPWHRAQDRNPWRRLVHTAMPHACCLGPAPDDGDGDDDDDELDTDPIYDHALNDDIYT